MVDADAGEVKEIASAVAGGTSAERILSGPYNSLNVAGAVKSLLRQISGVSAGGPIAANKQTGITKPDSITQYETFSTWMEAVTQTSDENARLLVLRRLFSALPNDNKCVTIAISMKPLSLPLPTSPCFL